MNGFCSLWCIEVVYNNKQIVGSWNEIKTDMYYSFKNFCIQLGYVMLLKYMYISSWTTSYCTCVKQSGFVNCFLIRWVPDGNADISLSLRGVYFICIDGCLSFYVHNVRQKSSALNSLKSRTGSDVTYSCHHNSSRFTFPTFVHACRFSVFHSLQSITPHIY